MSDINTKKPRDGRSPAYPFIPLEKALDQAEALRKAEGKYAVPLPSAFKAWGYGGKSSGARQTLAALKYFGLIDVHGEGDARQVKISELALRVLQDHREDKTEKKQLIAQLAIHPSINKNLRKKYPDGLPSDATVQYHLITDLKFNEAAAKEVLSQFKATAAFAGLYEPSTVIDIKEEKGDDEAERMDDEERPNRDVKPPLEKHLNPPPPPPPDKGVRLMDSERVVFTEEGQPKQYLKLVASGEVDDFLLEALEDFVKRQRKRIAAQKANEDKLN